MLGFAPTAGSSIGGTGVIVPVFIAAVTGFGLTLGGSSVATTHSATTLLSGVELTAEINNTAIYSFMDANAPVSTAGLVTLATIPGPIGTILGKYYNPPSLPIAVSLGALNLAGYDYVEQATGFDLTLDVGQVYSSSVYAAILDNHSQLANLALGTATGIVANQAAVTGVALTISGPTANAVATGDGAFETESLSEIAVEIGELDNASAAAALAGLDLGNTELGILANTNASSQITASFLIGTVSTNTEWTLNNSHPDIEVSLLATLSVGELANQSTSISLPGQSFALGFNGAVNRSSTQPLSGLALALLASEVTTQSFNTITVALPPLALSANLAGTDIFAVEFVTGSANMAVTASAASVVFIAASAAADVSADATASFGIVRPVAAAESLTGSATASTKRIRPTIATASTAVNSNAIAERLTVSFATASASAAATSVAAAQRARLTTAQAESAITGTATSRCFFSATAQASTNATANVFSSAILSGQGLGSANLLSSASASIDGDAWGDINTSDVDLWDDTPATAEVDPWTVIGTTANKPVNPWTII